LHDERLELNRKPPLRPYPRGEKHWRPAAGKKGGSSKRKDAAASSGGKKKRQFGHEKRGEKARGELGEKGVGQLLDQKQKRDLTAGAIFYLAQE